ncbi:MAG: gfo/Idh/MocA family oxidoreductase [Spirochaetaceae bacterium]|nr:MAG: gfo/Idh/MocA family oxidoreductase [Spirochaetaceae bacterium]
MPERNGMLKLGMVGGGKDAFIGAVHRSAARLDGEFQLVAGAFSSTPEKAIESGRELGVTETRNYPSWEDMLERERRLPADERLDAVSVVTPNHMHYPVSRAFVDAGFNVICDKPLVHTSQQADDLASIVRARGTVFAVTYNYTGYPMVRQARCMVQQGLLGDIRKVIVEYNQDWLANRAEAEGLKQAEWRTDPTRSGIAGAVGDIGSHAENLVSTITGLTLSHICADITTFVNGRLLDDDANVLLRFTSGAKGVLVASQISAGEENDLRIRIYGTRAGLTWIQENPNYLYYKPIGEPEQIYKRGHSYLCPEAKAAQRIPPGHPEAFLEAFANIYRAVAVEIRARQEGREPSPEESDFPSIEAGVRGVRFIESVIASAKSSEKWSAVR